MKEQAGIEKPREATDRAEVGVNQIPGLEDDMSQGDSALFQVSKEDQRGCLEPCRIRGKFYSSVLC